jgi:cellulose synthase (UDP-forming)
MSQGVYGERRERLTRIVAAASLVASAIYLGWRWGWTLDGEGLWFSLPLVLAETYGFLAAALLTYTGWRLHSRHPLPPLPDRTVDVVITTSDEPIAIIRRSALAARDIGYSHTTWLLASVHRADVHALALELGIHYLQRPDHAAGERLNHALQQSSGEFMLLLDASRMSVSRSRSRRSRSAKTAGLVTQTFEMRRGGTASCSPACCNPAGIGTMPRCWPAVAP